MVSGSTCLCSYLCYLLGDIGSVIWIVSRFGLEINLDKYQNVRYNLGITIICTDIYYPGFFGRNIRIGIKLVYSKVLKGKGSYICIR